MNHENDSTEQYVSVRNNLLAEIRQARRVLDDAEIMLSREDFKLPDKRPTLTLVGSFQSGKSTLFSYLCGGWELSKVGAGLRTTGCCVTATALPEGEHDYAEISWFSEDEIKEAISDYTGENVEKIRLSDLTWCKKYEQELLKLSRIWGDTGSQRVLWEIAPALLMLHFFNQYKDRCATGEVVRARDIEDAVAYAYYPPRWNQRWGEIRTVGDIGREFRKEDAAFVFCKRIDYYIDSSELRDLGCTIQDCPGMFATKRDTDLTNEILQRSDAILFTTPGEKELDASEVECIKKCQANGTAGKLVFGVNPHGSLQRWERIIKPYVLVQLLRMGFEKPEIIPFHASLALRCSELFQLLNGKLPRVSKNAIQNCIDASNYKSDTLEKHLLRLINLWIKRLDGGVGDCFNNYCDAENILWSKLNELHHVSTLIEHVKDTLKQARPSKKCGLLCDRLMLVSDTLEEISHKLRKGF